MGHLHHPNEQGKPITVPSSFVDNNTYGRILEEIEICEGIKVRLDVNRSKMKQLRFILKYSEWTEGVKSGDTQELLARVKTYVKQNMFEVNRLH